MEMRKLMTGKELIAWIEANNAEDLEVVYPCDATFYNHYDIEPKIRKLDEYGYEGKYIEL